MICSCLEKMAVLSASGGYVKADKKPLNKRKYCILVSTQMRHDERYVKKLSVSWMLADGIGTQLTSSPPPISVKFLILLWFNIKLNLYPQRYPQWNIRSKQSLRRVTAPDSYSWAAGCKTGPLYFKAPRLGPRAFSISVVNLFGGNFVW